MDALRPMFARWLVEPLPRPRGRPLPQQMRVTLTADVVFPDDGPPAPAG